MTTPAGAAAGSAAQYQAAQEGVAALAAQDVAAAFALLDLSNLAQTLPRFKAAIAGVVARYGAASASLALQHYRQQRREAGVASRITLHPARPAGVQEVAANVDWATRSLWSAEPDATTSRTEVAGATEKLVLDTGRSTMIQAVQDDRNAIGWVRQTEPGACYFCLLLETRGAKYKSRESAGPNRRSRRNRTNPGKAFIGEGEFKVHDHCRCVAIPIFHHYEPSAEARHWEQVYINATKGVTGTKDAINAFRRAVEAERSQ